MPAHLDHPLIPYLLLKENAAKAIDFYQKVFNAKLGDCMKGPDGKILHAELTIAESHIMLTESCPPGFSSEGCPSVTMCLQVPKVDDVVQKAVAEGAAIMTPVSDMFYGERAGVIKDPFGHIWHLSTFIRDLSPEELKKAAAKAFEEHQHGDGCCGGDHHH